jgi:homospermidine synthase
MTIPENLIASETTSGKDIIKVCEEMLSLYEKSIVIEHWRQYYFVRRFTKKNTSEKLYELQCETEGFSDCVKTIVKGGTPYPVNSVAAEKLLQKTAALFDRQTSAAKKRQKIR